MQTTHKIPGDSATRYAKYLTSTATRGDYYTRDGAVERSGAEPLARLAGTAAGARPRPRGPGRAQRPARGDAGLLPRERRAAAPRRLQRHPGRRGRADDGAAEVASRRSGRPPVPTAAPRSRPPTAARWRAPWSGPSARCPGEAEERRRRPLRAGQEPARPPSSSTPPAASPRTGAGGIPDPQLHSHLVLFAAGAQDGKLAAIESRRLYRSARESGAWYRAELAANLRELGLPIERRTGNGRPLLRGPRRPRAAGRRWSSRSEDVDRAARLFRQRYGREPRAGELGSLTTGTRGSKSAADRLDVDEAWRAVGEEHGLGAERAEGLFSERPVERSHVDLRAELLEEVTRERATIEERELRAKAYELAAGACRPREADELVAELARRASWSASRAAIGRPAACARWSRPRCRSPTAPPGRSSRR